MKKTLVALAAFAAVGAYAQSTVTLYGIVEPTVDFGYSKKTNVSTSLNGAAATTATTKANPGIRVQDGANQGQGSSRLGFKGTEDLGGGMKANFQLEAAIATDTGTTGGNSATGNTLTFARQAWGGVSGGFGEVRIGRQYNPSYFVQANSQVAGNANGLYDSAAITAPTVSAGTRSDNSIAYMSPSMSGFKAGVLYSAPEAKNETGANGAQTNSTKANAAYDFAVEYAKGPAYVGLAYGTGKTGSTAVAGNNDTEVKNKAYSLGAAYDFGVAKPYFNYTNKKTTRTNRNTATSQMADGGAAAFSLFNSDLALDSLAGSSGNGELKQKAYAIGVKVPMGATTLLAGYGRNKVDGSLRYNPVAADTTTSLYDLRSKAFQIGAQYALSKRTMLEANYGNNKVTGTIRDTNVVTATGVASVNATLGAGANSRVTTYDNKVSAVNFGLRHNF